jgi:hypothetical protein
MPRNFQIKYLGVSILMTFIGFLSFFASYFEVPSIVSLNSLLCFVALVGNVLFTIGTAYASYLTTSVLQGNSENPRGKCPFVMATFHQE